MPWMLPDKDVEYRHAVDLVSQSARTQLDILEALMGEPSTYTGLKEVLRGRNHNVLTKALRSLRDKGLIRHGLAADLESPVYALSELGKLVLLRSHEILPHRQSIEAYERGVRAAA